MKETIFFDLINMFYNYRWESHLIILTRNKLQTTRLVWVLFCIKNIIGVYKIHFTDYNLTLSPTHFEL